MHYRIVELPNSDGTRILEHVVNRLANYRKKHRASQADSGMTSSRQKKTVEVFTSTVE